MVTALTLTTPFERCHCHDDTPTPVASGEIGSQASVYLPSCVGVEPAQQVEGAPGMPVTAQHDAGPSA